MQGGCSQVPQLASPRHLTGLGQRGFGAGCCCLQWAGDWFPRPLSSGCSQLGGGWSSLLQQGLARITRGPGWEPGGYGWPGTPDCSRPAGGQTPSLGALGNASQAESALPRAPCGAGSLPLGPEVWCPSPQCPASCRAASSEGVGQHLQFGTDLRTGPPCIHPRGENLSLPTSTCVPSHAAARCQSPARCPHLAGEAGHTAEELQQWGQ